MITSECEGEGGKKNKENEGRILRTKNKMNITLNSSRMEQEPYFIYINNLTIIDY